MPCEIQSNSLSCIGKSATGNGGSYSGGVAGDCLICMQPITRPKRLQCGHHFCKSCIEQWEKQRPVCPTCNKRFGLIIGNQPVNATMHVATSAYTHLPGYPKAGTITITYDVPSGTQGTEHPNPGKYYTGTRRVAYLPDTQQGRELLELLRKAFEAHLIFTVGRSVTSGYDNSVTWNDIHHKTNLSGGP